MLAQGLVAHTGPPQVDECRGLLAAQGGVVSTNDAALTRSHALALRHKDARWGIAAVESADSPRDQTALGIALRGCCRRLIGAAALLNQSS